MQSILIVDDLESIHEMLDAVIQPIGYHTAFATDGEIALQKIREERYDIVLTDINMKPMDGLALLSQIREADPQAIVIMMSGYANIENATQSLKLGAFDYLTKPFKVDELMAAINRASMERKRRLESGDGEAAQNAIFLSGESPSARSLGERINRAAKLPSTVLVTGEQGTQKSIVASLIHAKSELADGPFVTIDANASDANELKQLLFKAGEAPSDTILSAHGGFLFLANIDRMPRELQAPLGKLLRDEKNEMRVVCSTSRDLEKLVETGEFDDALYFRVANNPLPVPSLRERSEDVAALALSFFAKNHLPFNALGEKAAALLQGYRWPGNYVEFQEVLTAAAAVSEGQTIREADLPEKLQDTASWPDLERFLAEQAEHYKRQVIKACQGDAGKAAEVLGVDPSHLSR